MREAAGSTGGFFVGEPLSLPKPTCTDYAAGPTTATGHSNLLQLILISSIFI